MTKCAEKACPFARVPDSDLCQHHARMFSGHHAFESKGQRQMADDAGGDREREKQAEAARARYHAKNPGAQHYKTSIS